VVHPDVRRRLRITTAETRRDDGALAAITALCESVPHLSFVAAPDGGLIHANLQLLRFTGRSLRELVGRPNRWLEIVAAHDQTVAALLSRSVQPAKDEIREAECRLVAADGSLHWFLARVKPVVTSGRTFLCWNGTFTDIDRRKTAVQALHLSEAEFRVLAEQLPQVMYRVASDGAMTFVNRCFVDTLGDARFDPFAAVVAADRQRATTEAHARRAHGEEFEMELRVSTQSGVRWFLARERPVRDARGDFRGRIGVWTDVHAGKSAAITSRLIAEVTDVAVSTQSTAPLFAQAVRACAGTLGSMCAIDLFEAGKLRRVACALSGDILEDPCEAAALERSAQSRIVVTLNDAHGIQLGAMLFLETRPDEPSFDDAARNLAYRVAHRIERRLQAFRSFQQQYHIAREFQRASLPSAMPTVDGVTIAVAYRAGDHTMSVGGDWYDAFGLPDGRLALVVGDVTGRGLEAALAMARLRHGIRALATVTGSVEEMAGHADALLRCESADTYATAFFGIYDRQGRELRYVLCGHPAPLLRSPSGEVRELEGYPHLPLGLLGAAGPSCASALEVEPGSLLFCFTDGLIESGRDALDGLPRLYAAVSDLELATHPDRLIDRLLRDGSDDDAVAIAISFCAELPG
jgi:PAS domain S-box-containing protein